MNTIKITTEMSKEDRQLVEGLTGAINLLASVLGNMQPAEVRQKIIQEAEALCKQEPKLPYTITQAEDGTVKLDKNDHPADAPTTHLEPADAPPASPVADPAPVEPAPEVKPVSLAEFQKVVTQTVAKGQKQKAAAKEIINKYSPSVSEVPESKRAEVMAELAKI